MSNWGILLLLSVTMCNGRICFIQALTMRLIVISGFGVNLNPLDLFIIIKHIGLNVPSRLNRWSSFKSKASPLVLTRFPSSNVWLCRAVSIGGRLPLHQLRKGTLIASRILNKISLGLKGMSIVWGNVELTGWDLTSSRLFGVQQNHIGKIFHWQKQKKGSNGNIGFPIMDI